MWVVVITSESLCWRVCQHLRTLIRWVAAGEMPHMLHIPHTLRPPLPLAGEEEMPAGPSPDARPLDLRNIPVDIMNDPLKLPPRGAPRCSGQSPDFSSSWNLVQPLVDPPCAHGKGSFRYA